MTILGLTTKVGLVAAPVLATLLLALPALAFDLSLPADCVLGETCHFQNYVDRDPGPGAADFTCGPLAYDGHDGTDLRIATLAAMEAGTDVLAPADGVVIGIRDGMPDISVSDPAAPPLAGRDCGNGIAIDHGGGWQTQLCHMKQGSVTVAGGDRVTRGQPLGQIGLSGNTEFPHVHLAVRRDGVSLDPFAPDSAAACGAAQPTLWADPVAYDASGVLDAGWATAIPEFEAIRAGIADQTLAPASPAVVAWVYLFGTRAGDSLAFDITGPDGPLLAETVAIDRTQAEAFRAVGLRNRATLPAGTYRATVTWTRDGAQVERTEFTTTIP